MKRNKSEVDIILPNYNSSNFIEATIRSVLNQNFKNWNLIIIDDCSDIKTKKIITKFQKDKKIKIFWMKKNRGPGYCRNYGIKNSNSKYIAFIDSDDIWQKNKLKLQINFMEKYNYDFTYTNYKTFGLKNKFVEPPKTFTFKEFIRNTSIGTSTMMVKRKIIKGVKFTNTEICEDYFFKCKILQKINIAYCLNIFLTKYRIRHNSLQSSKMKNLFWIWKINKNFNNFSFFQNLYSLYFISLNSFKKYGLK